MTDAYENGRDKGDAPHTSCGRVVRAEERDIDRILDLLLEVNNVHAAGRPDIFVKDRRKYGREEVTGLLSREDVRIYCWRDEQDVTEGYAFCLLEETAGGGNLVPMKTFYIDDICVEESERRKHIGTALYEYARKEAAAIGCCRVTLNVWELNPGAKAFYEKMGMKPLKTVMEEVL